MPTYKDRYDETIALLKKHYEENPPSDNSVNHFQTLHEYFQKPLSMKNIESKYRLTLALYNTVTQSPSDMQKWGKTPTDAPQILRGYLKSINPSQEKPQTLTERRLKESPEEWQEILKNFDGSSFFYQLAHFACAINKKPDDCTLEDIFSIKMQPSARLALERTIINEKNPLGNPWKDILESEAWKAQEEKMQYPPPHPERFARYCISQNIHPDDITSLTRDEYIDHMNKIPNMFVKTSNRTQCLNILENFCKTFSDAPEHESFVKNFIDAKRSHLKDIRSYSDQSEGSLQHDASRLIAILRQMKKEDPSIQINNDNVINFIEKNITEEATPNPRDEVALHYFRHGKFKSESTIKEQSKTLPDHVQEALNFDGYSENVVRLRTEFAISKNCEGSLENTADEIGTFLNTRDLKPRTWIFEAGWIAGFCAEVSQKSSHHQPYTKQQLMMALEQKYISPWNTKYDRIFPIRSLENPQKIAKKYVDLDDPTGQTCGKKVSFVKAEIPKGYRGPLFQVAQGLLSPADRKKKRTGLHHTKNAAILRGITQSVEQHLKNMIANQDPPTATTITVRQLTENDLPSGEEYEKERNLLLRPYPQRGLFMTSDKNITLPNMDANNGNFEIVCIYGGIRANPDEINILNDRYTKEKVESFSINAYLPSNQNFPGKKSGSIDVSMGSPSADALHGSTFESPALSQELYYSPYGSGMAGQFGNTAIKSVDGKLQYNYERINACFMPVIADFTDNEGYPAQELLQTIIAYKPKHGKELIVDYSEEFFPRLEKELQRQEQEATSSPIQLPQKRSLADTDVQALKKSKKHPPLLREEDRMQIDPSSPVPTLSTPSRQFRPPPAGR